jgi:hypothetical protein
MLRLVDQQGLGSLKLRILKDEAEADEAQRKRHHILSTRSQYEIDLNLDILRLTASRLFKPSCHLDGKTETLREGVFAASCTYYIAYTSMRSKTGTIAPKM